MSLDNNTVRGASTIQTKDGDAPLLPFLFLVMECGALENGASRVCLSRFDEVRFKRGAARGATIHDEDGVRRLELTVADPQMSTRHARLFRDGQTWVLEDSGSTNGTRIDGARIVRQILGSGADGGVFQLGGSLFLLEYELPSPQGTEEVLHIKRAVAGVSTLLPEYASSMIAFARMAASEVPILLLGESGTGKEVLARAVHGLSGRRGAFVPVNCGALPETLLESQLFGHMKGAFSGAVKDEPGFVRASDKGTLFLDEIGDMPRTSQAALLRVLQEREVTPVGSTQPVKVALRVVSATHRQLSTLTETGAFRADLYARLSGYAHLLVPLRDRMCDLGLLVSSLMTKIRPGKPTNVTAELGRALLSYGWPLNVRELEQALSVAAVLATDDVVKMDHLPESLRKAMKAPRASHAPDAPRASAAPASDASDDVLKDRLVASLSAHKGNVSEVARSLGRTRMQIHRWMKRWGISPDTYR
jgi:transcriptional regulator of acetoin/glycerol metabolism